MVQPQVNMCEYCGMVSVVRWIKVSYRSFLKGQFQKKLFQKEQNDMIRLINTVKPVFVATAGKGWAPFVMHRSLVTSEETDIA